MIVKFSTRNGHLAMLGESAVRLLQCGGHSGTVPGAILAPELPAFLARLRTGLVTHGDEPSPLTTAPVPADDSRDDQDEPRERTVSLRQRAVPLIDMIETAIARGSDLMWERA